MFGRELVVEAHGALGAQRIVGRLLDALAAGDLVLGGGQALLHAAQVREHVALGHAGGDAHGYSPTRPARLISVSSMSSIVDMTRAEAW